MKPFNVRSPLITMAAVFSTNHHMALLLRWKTHQSLSPWLSYPSHHPNLVTMGTTRFAAFTHHPHQSDDLPTRSATRCLLCFVRAAMREQISSRDLASSGKT
ncbi:hypothetical protein ACLOJK_005342 [Asimina triloba]